MTFLADMIQFVVNKTASVWFVWMLWLPSLWYCLMISFVTHDIWGKMTGYLVSIDRNSRSSILLTVASHNLIIIHGWSCKQINLLLLEIPYPFFSDLYSSAKLFCSCALLMNQSPVSFTSDGRISPTIFLSIDLFKLNMNQISQPEIHISLFLDEWHFGSCLHNDGVSDCMTSAEFSNTFLEFDNHLWVFIPHNFHIFSNIEIYCIIFSFCGAHCIIHVGWF